MKLVAFLLPLGYLGLLLAVVVHELVGHGLVALALGGTFRGFTIHWDAMGWAAVSPPAVDGVWRHVAILSGGIMATTIVGSALLVYAGRRRSDSVLTD